MHSSSLVTTTTHVSVFCGAEQSHFFFAILFSVDFVFFSIFVGIFFVVDTQSHEETTIAAATAASTSAAETANNQDQFLVHFGVCRRQRRRRRRFFFSVVSFHFSFVRFGCRENISYSCV